ncbi:hypothetical protein [Hymenobacter sp. BRD67]|uniref:hypothetical protein n=1 Tax=Hymenobacter sp. BRD67 TaxID=2675877 RepID=UPI001566911B|nr:hypothetical protein [Hymenobacter sp. BRD67]QKG53158.1 hypothetical protein GKZ67_11835 [Hymenobacter sp. BRD67]
MPLPTRIWAPTLASCLLAFSSCHKDCAPAITAPQPFSIAFSTDTLSTGRGFHKAEALSAYLVRYADTELSQPLDTVRTSQKPGNFFYVDRTLFCNFPASAGAADPHSYRLEVPATKSRYDIQAVVLQYGGTTACTRSIDRLDALVNGQRVDARRGYVVGK